MIRLPELPYAYEALAPMVSAETMHLHHDKHHARYIAVVNEVLEQKGQTDRAVEDLVRESGAAGETKLYNNAGQTWNHGFFWDVMAPGGGQPTDGVQEVADRTFGGWDGFRGKFVEAGMAVFGSGWIWAVSDGQGVKLVGTPNGDSFDKLGGTPLFGCDVWEHAYYVDYRNDRKTYLENWFDGVVNWSLVDRQLQAAKGAGAAWASRSPAPPWCCSICSRFIGWSRRRSSHNATCSRSRRKSCPGRRRSRPTRKRSSVTISSRSRFSTAPSSGSGPPSSRCCWLCLRPMAWPG